MRPVDEFVRDVHQRVPAYQRFLREHGIIDPLNHPFDEIPLQTKQNYLLKHPVEDICWDGEIGSCHLIGSSSGFSKSGSVFWPKRPEDEKNYLRSIEKMLAANYQIDQKRTLILCCMALGTWFGGMAITAAVRVLAAEGRLPITVCTPGLNLSEAVEVFSRFHQNFEQSLWVTNPSSIGLISALLKRKGIVPAPGSMSFPVVGEYFSEAFRESVAAKYGHESDAPFVVWTGYGSADAGDLGVETADLIRLRKFFHRNEPERKRLFGADDTPMLLMPASSKHLEVIDGRIVVSADHLVPLVRYDTGDEGGFIEKRDLPTGIAPELLKRLPEKLLYVRGRVNDNVIFYGTNLNVQEVNSHFLGLPKDYGYAGLFTVRSKEQFGVVFFDFTVLVEDDSDSLLAQRYKETLLEFLKTQSLEFRAKYASLTQSVGEELIRVRLDRYRSGEGRIKHRFIVSEE